jgi:hypothetical protein
MIRAALATGCMMAAAVPRRTMVSAHLIEILSEPPNVRKAQITEARFALVAQA